LRWLSFRQRRSSVWDAVKKLVLPLPCQRCNPPPAPRRIRRAVVDAAGPFSFLISPAQPQQGRLLAKLGTCQNRPSNDNDARQTLSTPSNLVLHCLAPCSVHSDVGRHSDPGGGTHRIFMIPDHLTSLPIFSKSVSWDSTYAWTPPLEAACSFGKNHQFTVCVGKIFAEWSTDLMVSPSRSVVAAHPPHFLGFSFEAVFLCPTPLSSVREPVRADVVRVQGSFSVSAGGVYGDFPRPRRFKGLGLVFPRLSWFGPAWCCPYDSPL